MSVLVIYKDVKYSRQINNILHDKKIKDALKEHIISLKYCCDFLDTLSIKYTKQKIIPEKEISIHKNISLVLTVGGDGTFLYVAQAISKQSNIKILGINSSPSMSVGYYCPYSLIHIKKQEEWKKNLLAIFNNQKVAKKYYQLCLFVNQKPSCFTILNDALITEKYPAKTSVYSMEYKKIKEVHKSSGIWVATYTGSFGGYKSSGGKLFNMNRQKIISFWKYAFVVREMCYQSVKLKNKVLKNHEKFIIKSGMQNGFIYIDGGIAEIPLNKGDEISFQYMPDLFISYFD